VGGDTKKVFNSPRFNAESAWQESHRHANFGVVVPGSFPQWQAVSAAWAFGEGGGWVEWLYGCGTGRTNSGHFNRGRTACSILWAGIQLSSEDWSGRGRCRRWTGSQVGRRPTNLLPTVSHLEDPPSRSSYPWCSRRDFSSGDPNLRSPGQFTFYWDYPRSGRLSRSHPLVWLLSARIV